MGEDKRCSVLSLEMAKRTHAAETELQLQQPRVRAQLV